MKTIPKSFIGGALLGAVVGFVVGALLPMWLAIRVERMHLQHREQRALARRDTAQPAPFPTPGLLPPDRALDFDFGLPLTTPEGQPFDLRALRGQVLVVNVWATWCRPCLAELPSLEALAARLGGNGRVSFLLVSRDTQANLQAYLRGHGMPRISLAVLPPGVELPGFADVVPETLVVAADGKVCAIQPTGTPRPSWRCSRSCRRPSDDTEPMADLIRVRWGAGGTSHLVRFPG
jgi:thiol-disulfide isomerase/thioredoxin